MAAVAVAVSLVVLALLVINAGMHGPDSRNIELMGWFVIVLAPPMVGLAVWQTGEKINPSTGGDGPKLKDYLQLLTKPDLMRLYLAHFALTLGPGWMSSLYILFSRDYKGFTASQASILLLVYTVAGMIGGAAGRAPGHPDRQAPNPDGGDDGLFAGPVDRTGHATGFAAGRHADHVLVRFHGVGFRAFDPLHAGRRRR